MPLLALLLFFVVAPLQAQSDRLLPTDVFNLEYVTDPQVSPDGQWVAYVRNFGDAMTDRWYSNIWLARTDGSEQRPLTTGKVNDGGPRWSPDGKRLGYLSTRDGTPQIYVRWMESGQVQPVTSVTEPPMGFQWSPDGRQIAFVKLVPAAPLVIGAPPAPPPGAQWAPPVKYTDKLVFRFDGLGEIPPGYLHLFVVPSEGGTARQVTSGNYNHGTSGWGGSDFDWASDSRSLVFAARRSADAENRLLEADLWEVSLADGKLTRITDRDGPDGSVDVSPDGRSIAWVGFDDRKVGYQVTQLYVANRDGSNKRVVSAKLDRDAGSPAWSADGKSIYFMYDDQGNTKLAVTTLDGTVKVLARDLGSMGIAYGIGGFSVANDGTLAWTLSRPDVIGELAVQRPSQPLRMLTALNEDVFAGKKLGKVEEIWWNSSKDQRKIQGWIITPPGFDPAKKYPLILEIHGGPFANYGDRFDTEKQLMASFGYVVLYANPRGSTSYGEEFGNLIHHAYPGDDFYDLNSGVDAVIARGFVDPNQLYVSGGSGGGVLTAWMIGHTNRFKAALAFYPVINWESFVLTADMAPLGVANWFPGFPWDHRDNYDQRSLLSVVKNVKTPTLIMTGEEDYRTPMSESEQYYKALKMLGVETVLARVPGESHGIRNRPSHYMAKMTTLQGWFEKHRATTP